MNRLCTRLGSITLLAGLSVRPSMCDARSDSILVGALQRSYLVRLPSAYDGVDPLPLVIAMHGGFGSGAQLEQQSLLTAKADEEGFIVVYPDGVPSNLGIRTWNAGGCCGYAMNNGIDDVGFINALLDTLLAAYAIDEQRVYATGMSNGGFMAYRLACELSARIAAIAPVSASMTIDVCQPDRPVPVLGLHSYLDESVPWQGGIGNGVSAHYNSPQDSVQTVFAMFAGCTVLRDTIQNDAELTVVRWHDCDCGSEMLLYMTHYGGHSWPGGTQTGGFADPPSQVIDANDLMWDFFQGHVLDCGDAGTGPAQVSNTINIGPQPNTGLVRITGGGLSHVRLLDAAGRELRAERPTGNTLEWDLTAVAPGRYLLLITDSEDRTLSRPLMLLR